MRFEYVWFVVMECDDANKTARKSRGAACMELVCKNVMSFLRAGVRMYEM